MEISMESMLVARTDAIGVIFFIALFWLALFWLAIYALIRLSQYRRPFDLDFHWVRTELFGDWENNRQWKAVLGYGPTYHKFPKSKWEEKGASYEGECDYLRAIIYYAPGFLNGKTTDERRKFFVHKISHAATEDTRKTGASCIGSHNSFGDKFEPVGDDGTACGQWWLERVTLPADSWGRLGMPPRTFNLSDWPGWMAHAYLQARHIRENNLANLIEEDCIEFMCREKLTLISSHYEKHPLNKNSNQTDSDSF